MKKFIFFAVLLSNTAFSAEYADRSKLDTPEMVTCAAAAMKSGQRISVYKVWVKALDERYKRMRPNMSAKERDSYTADRVMSKVRALQARGLSTAPAFRQFYDTNCLPYTPKND